MNFGHVWQFLQPGWRRATLGEPRGSQVVLEFCWGLKGGRKGIFGSTIFLFVTFYLCLNIPALGFWKSPKRWNQWGIWHWDCCNDCNHRYYWFGGRELFHSASKSWKFFFEGLKRTRRDQNRKKRRYASVDLQDLVYSSFDLQIIASTLSSNIPP